MGKSVGFIGNFKGKLGNAVGYKVSQSNSGTNQGVRVYQPNIKNPKSAAQAEQRAKYAPIFATYRALKMIIDRGNESKPYGNASRIAWLKKTFRSSVIPWTPQGETVKYPVLCELTSGSLQNMVWLPTEDNLMVTIIGLTRQSDVSKVGLLSEAILNAYPYLKVGDQITFINVSDDGQSMFTDVYSFILDPNSTEPTKGISAGSSVIYWEPNSVNSIFSVIVSREGAHGEHLRTTSRLSGWANITQDPPYDDASKQAAIASYMATNGANADWAEESIQ